jgi:hypothetical protein
MYTAEVTIRNLSDAPDKEFRYAANAFLEKLSSISDLQVTISEEKVQGSRGEIPILEGIIVTGINLGLFSAIYTLAKDLYSIYANAEVELQFKDGSKLTLKNLPQEEAEMIISDHLKNASVKG